MASLGPLRAGAGACDDIGAWDGGEALAHRQTHRSHGRRRKRTGGSLLGVAAAAAAALALLSSPQPAASAFSLGGPSRPLRTAAARSTRLQVGGVYRDFVDDAQASDGKGHPGQGRISAGFEGRMRDRFMKQKRQQRGSAGDIRRYERTNVRRVNTLSQYKSVVSETMDGMLVVRFYATWCGVSVWVCFCPVTRMCFFVYFIVFNRTPCSNTISFVPPPPPRCFACRPQSCKQIAPVFYKLARALPGITFVEVPINDENINLHHGLGVPSVPFAHIYYHGVLAEELKLNKRHFPRFLYHVKAYVRGRCMLPEDGDCSDPFPNEEEESLDTYS